MPDQPDTAYPPNPECRQGKHRNCDGYAWNDRTDSPDACLCQCHREFADSDGGTNP